jgi:aspartate aminotransferase
MKLSPEIQDSLELRFSGLARRMNERGDRIISLGLGEPSFPTPPEIVEAAAEAMRQGFTRYSNPMGLPDLREAICAKLAKDNGIQAGPDDVMVTPGAKMALSLALAAILEPGDEVINLVPCYPSYLPQIRIAEPAAVIKNLDLRRPDFGLDLDRLAGLLTPRVKAVIINSPHNPTGKMLTSAELKALVALLSNSGCWLISDEIYERLNFSNTAHLSPGAVETMARRTITINGFSKAFSMTGWRIGYLVAKGPVMKTISKLQQHMNTNVAPFVQKAAKAARALPQGFLDQYNRRLAGNAACLAEAVTGSSPLRLCPGQGGMFAFLDIAKTGVGSDVFCSGLLERHAVAVTPGINFGGGWDDHVRISLDADAAVFAEGASRLASFADTIANERHVSHA